MNCSKPRRRSLRTLAGDMMIMAPIEAPQMVTISEMWMRAAGFPPAIMKPLKMATTTKTQPKMTAIRHLSKNARAGTHRFIEAADVDLLRAGNVRSVSAVNLTGCSGYDDCESSPN